MNIEDEGILVAKFKYGEGSLILSIFSKKHGLVKGILKSGTSLKNKAILEIGNVLKFQKRSRNEEALGFFKVEVEESYLYKIFQFKNKLLALASICELMAEFTLEKEVDEDFYELSKSTIIVLQKEDFIKYYIRWELKLLEKIGIGLDLQKCVVSKQTENLYYLSPKTGKAVVKEVGLPYANKLFIIPLLFKNMEAEPTKENVFEAFKVLNHFFNMFCNEYHKKMPFARDCLIKNLMD
ncbi:MAG: DNA repair protein RecO [Alphaproteobacteria bacterium]|jgi:DNA repair protein RecO (recombination protein O)|nr:DNA repair protein RecO [Alphaproteobacteria bacterium]